MEIWTEDTRLLGVVNKHSNLLIIFFVSFHFPTELFAFVFLAPNFLWYVIDDFAKLLSFLLSVLFYRRFQYIFRELR